MCVRVCVCVLCHISTDIIYIATRSASARHGMAYGWRGPSTARVDIYFPYSTYSPHVAVMSHAPCMYCHCIQ